ncbi:MAG: hypothetical protein AB8G99_23640, partial [Planctomycetaceae bacterium]
RERIRQTIAFFKPPARLLSLLFPPIYFAAVLLLEYSKGSGLSDRVLMPAVPFAIATLVALVSQVTHSRVSRFVINAMCLVLFVSFLVGQYSAFQLLAKTSPPGPELNQIMQAEMETGQTIASFLRANVSSDEPLLANQPQLVHGILKCPVAGLATGRYNTGEPWVAKRVESEVINRFDVRYVLAVRGPRIKDHSTPVFFMELDRGVVPDYLKCIFRTEQATLFEVVEPIRSSSL